MKERKSTKDLQRLATMLRMPLTDKRVTAALKGAMVHIDGAMKAGARKGPRDQEVRLEGQEALRELLVAMHAATEVLLAGMEMATQNVPSGGALQEVRVKRAPAARRRKKKQR
jgi:hypothetical protein